MHYYKTFGNLKTKILLIPPASNRPTKKDLDAQCVDRRVSAQGCAIWGS